METNSGNLAIINLPSCHIHHESYDFFTTMTTTLHPLDSLYHLTSSLTPHILVAELMPLVTCY